MAENYMKFTDVAQLTHNGNIVAMAEEFQKSTSLFSSLPWKASSDAMHDVTGVVDSIPGATWVGLDKGVKANKGSWKQKEEDLAILESWSATNEKTYKMSGNGDYARWMNDQLHIKGMALEAEKKLLYGNATTNVNEINGFMTRMNATTDRNGKKSGTQKGFICLDAGGSSANAESSILLIAKGPMCPTLLYPKYKANNGIEYNAFPFENAKDDENGNIRLAYSQFIVSFGLSIAHAQTCVRIANIDTTSNGTTSINNLSDAIYEAFAAIPREFRSSVDIWASPSVILKMRQKYANRVSPTTYQDAIYKNAIGDVLFDNFVIRSCDSMVDTEAVVS